MITCANPTCHTQFEPKSFIHRFCSGRCRRMARGDEWGWVREEALDRDSHECQECHATECLQVHHIVPVCMGGDSSLENVITLCVICHRGVHKSWARWRKEENGEEKEQVRRSISDAISTYAGGVGSRAAA